MATASRKRPATARIVKTAVRADQSVKAGDPVRKEQAEQLSCVPADQKRYTKQATAKEAPNNIEENDAGKRALADHLRSIAPFNRRWNVTRTINEGTFGVVFAVQDIETGVEGVIKVAKSDGNAPAKWEAFILEKMMKANPSASVVRILDKGMLADHNGNGMEFMVLEKAAIPIMQYIGKFSGKERDLHVSFILLDMLKGIHDMHCQGLLHRDLKPDNMGIVSKTQPFAVLFDLGMVRMYTGYFGEVRLPRSAVYFRGTPEWASGHACKGREQCWLDDLIGWMYVAVELYDDTQQPNQPLPWTQRNTTKGIRYLKSVFGPARLIFQRCPSEFYAINAYLMTANRFVPPNYNYLVFKMNEIIERLQKELGGAHAYNRYTCVGNKSKTEEEKMAKEKAELDEKLAKEIEAHLRRLEVKNSTLKDVKEREIEQKLKTEYAKKYGIEKLKEIERKLSEEKKKAVNEEEIKEKIAKKVERQVKQEKKKLKDAIEQKRRTLQESNQLKDRKSKKEGKKRTVVLASPSSPQERRKTLALSHSDSNPKKAKNKKKSNERKKTNSDKKVEHRKKKSGPKERVKAPPVSSTEFLDPLPTPIPTTIEPSEANVTMDAGTAKRVHKTSSSSTKKTYVTSPDSRTGGTTGSSGLTKKSDPSKSSDKPLSMEAMAGMKKRPIQVKTGKKGKAHNKGIKSKSHSESLSKEL